MHQRTQPHRGHPVQQGQSSSSHFVCLTLFLWSLAPSYYSYLGAHSSLVMADRVSFVFVHGAWHSSWYWQPVCSLLTASGHSAHAIDLPGAGEHAVNPEGYHPRSPQFVTETEPTRSKVTQEQRTRAVVDAVEAAIANDRRPVVLVAHSFGGASVTPGAELLGDKVAAVVYVSSFMLPPGWTPGGLARRSRCHGRRWNQDGRAGRPARHSRGTY